MLSGTNVPLVNAPLINVLHEFQEWQRRQAPVNNWAKK